MCALCKSFAGFYKIIESNLENLKKVTEEEFILCAIFFAYNSPLLYLKDLQQFSATVLYFLVFCLVVSLWGDSVVMRREPQ